MLALQRSAGNHAVLAILRNERVPGKLYKSTHDYESGQGKGDYIGGNRLIYWARSAGIAFTRSEAVFKRLQEDPDSMPAILTETQALLERELRSAKFQGTDQARDEAVAEMRKGWPSLRDWFKRDLTRIFDDSVANALGRTPGNAELETDPAVIRRVRHNPKRDVTQSDRWGAMIKVGHNLGGKIVDDIVKNPYPGGEHEKHLATVPGELWFHLDDQPLWYYRTSTDPVQLQAFASSVYAQVAASTQFAAMFFPILIKGMAIGAGIVAGFPAGLAARIALEIGAAAIDELASEGMDDARGRKRRTPDEIAKSMGVQVLLSLVMGRLFGGGSKATAGELAAFEIKAAGNVRKAVAEIEGPEVAAAVKAGRASPVEDVALAEKGYVREVPIRSHGESHVYRQHADGTWCRFSKIGMCNIELTQDGLKGAPKGARPKTQPAEKGVTEETGGGVKLHEKPKTKPAKEAGETAKKPAATPGGPGGPGGPGPGVNAPNLAGVTNAPEVIDQELVLQPGNRVSHIPVAAAPNYPDPYAWFTHASGAAKRSAGMTDIVGRRWMHEMNISHLRGRQVGWFTEDGSGWRLDWRPGGEVHVNWQRVVNGVRYSGAIRSGLRTEQEFLNLLNRLLRPAAVRAGLDVPAAQHPPLALEAEHAHRRGAERELAAAVGPEPDPARAELPQQVRVGEHERVAVGGQRALDDAIGARGELVERLALGEVVAPDVPAGVLDADLLGRAALVDAVVALAEVLVDLGAVAEAGQLGGPAGALHRRAEHEREVAPGELRDDRERLLLARPGAAGGRCVPVCCPERLHSVSPWRTRTISLIASSGSAASSGGAKSPCVCVRRRATRSWW